MLVMQTSPSDNEGDRTFINKLKRLFSKDPVTNLYEPKLYFVSQTIFAGSIAGFFYWWAHWCACWCSRAYRNNKTCNLSITDTCSRMYIILTLLFIMLKNNQTYFKNPAGFLLQYYWIMFGDFSTLNTKELTLDFNVFMPVWLLSLTHKRSMFLLYRNQTINWRNR